MNQLECLQAENMELRAHIQALEELLTSHPANQGEEPWIERQKEYEALLEEKSEVIRALHLQLQALREHETSDDDPGETTPAQTATPQQDGEVDHLKQQLADEREQLVQDEDALMKQMRDMEMTMSRERAEMARQRTELQRLHSDIKHELEMAARNAGLRERLAPLQRRHQDLIARKGS